VAYLAPTEPQLPDDRTRCQLYGVDQLWGFYSRHRAKVPGIVNYV